MAFLSERTAEGWRVYDPENPAIDVTHADRATALDSAQAALTRYEEAKSAPQAIPEESEKTPRKRRIRRKQATSPGPPAEEQLSYLERPYLPVVDRLFACHNLNVPDDTRKALTSTITHMRGLSAEGFCESDTPKKKEQHTPIPALEKARTHIVKLLEYAEHPPAHKSRIATRCASLRRALLDSQLAASELALESLGAGDSLDYGLLLDDLGDDLIDVAALTKVLGWIDSILARGENWRMGQRGILMPVVRIAYIAWVKARNFHGATFSFNATNEKLNKENPFTAFLLDLVACCDGTHELVQKPPRPVPKGYPLLEKPKMGDTLKPSHDDLRKAIIACQKDERLKEWLAPANN